MKQQREMGTTPMMTTEQIALGVPVVHGVPEKRAPEKSAPEKSAPEKPSSWFPTWHGGVDYDGAAELRAKLGYPKGLAKQVCESLVSTPLHFWVVDNSYSMGATDGKRICEGKRVVRCTRTDELRDAVLEQVMFSTCVKARTDFHHLNMPRSGNQYVTLTSDVDRSGCAYAGATCSGRDEACAALSQAIEPCGATPLAAAVQQIYMQLAPLAAHMRARAERAVVVIATDGMPNSPSAFLQALALLQASCPVWIVVRLCTSDPSIVRYWSDLDKHLEAPLEVLDDVFGEADEVGRVNDWLVYGPQLHGARLFGLQHKLFDVLDEHELLPCQIRQLCELLLGCDKLPDPDADIDAFQTALEVALEGVPYTYDARRKEQRAWIDVPRLVTRLRAREALETAVSAHALRLSADEMSALTSTVTAAVATALPFEQRRVAESVANQLLRVRVEQRERRRAAQETLKRLGLYGCLGSCV